MKVNIKDVLKELEDKRYLKQKEFMQHGTTSVYEHSLKVTQLSLKIALKLHLPVNRYALIRGALLHDYFLYDWHDDGHKYHGFTHPYIAYKNACEDFFLTYIEEDIIKHHMFPLVPIPPPTIEGWIVCIADKISASAETLSPYLRKMVKE